MCVFQGKEGEGRIKKEKKDKLGFGERNESGKKKAKVIDKKAQTKRAKLTKKKKKSQRRKEE